MAEHWQNWGRSVETHPQRIEHPASTAEVSGLVREASAAGLKIKAVGASHSFTAIAATDGIQLLLDRMNRILSHDKTTSRVRVQAGISLHELNPRLKALSLALPNLGDVDPQSVAGAVSTGTHGTGGKLFGIAKTVVGVQLVTATGDVLEIDEHHEWFGASRVTLGALGIVTEVTLQCVPAFLLHAREEPMALPEVLDRVGEFTADNHHFEFYWFPHTEKALIKRNNRVPDGTERKPVGRFKHWLDDEFLSNTVFDGLNRVVARKRGWIPRVNNIAASMLSAREYVDDSYNVFVSERTVRFRESEFAVPREALNDVLAELKAWFGAGHENISFPIEVRFTAADDIWMSTGHERDNCYVAVHQYVRSDYASYFAAAQDIFTAHEGRPHWGKIHTLDASYFAERYAKFHDFVSVRDKLDPARTFSNPYLDRVLG
ncbi:MAG: FAD-linked oxidoreductase [Aeromicrobium sp.]|nr:FAD-linked oxidoreductase [Aeromicrobium sp.]